MLSFSQITTPVSEESAFSTIMTGLQNMGFSATSWQSGSIQYTFWRYIAKLYAGFTSYAAANAKGRFPQYATGDAQEALGQYSYDLLIRQAIATQGLALVTLAADAPAASWDVSELVFADTPTGPGNTYRIADAGSLLPGESVQVTAEAEAPGAAANIANSTTLYLRTPITGLSVTNPVPEGEVVGTPWITRVGQDKESQSSYASRMIGRWSRLAYGNTEGAYAAWAREALPALTRVTVTFGEDDGTVVIVGATAVGGLTAEQIQTISDYIHGVLDGKGRRPINDIVTVESATVVTTPAQTITVVCDSAYIADAASRVSAALLSLYGTLPIGGEILPPDTTGRVYGSTMYRAVMALTGIRNVSPFADVPLTSTQIYVPTFDVTVVPA